MALEREPATTPQADHFSSNLDVMSDVFVRFGDVECKQIRSPLYACFSFGIAEDEDMLRLAANRLAGQPPPNIIFAAVHYLLLGGTEHELREYYPALTPNARAPEDGGYAAFRDFCLTHEARLRGLISTRTVQTNVVRRSIVLLPAFALVSQFGGGKPLAQIEVGASAGLNLNWSSYHFDYGGGVTWGDEASPVQLTAELQGDFELPPLNALAAPAWARGIDLQPVLLQNEDSVRWLRSLVWPENVLLSEQLAAAVDLAKAALPHVVQGDASDLLPAFLEDASADPTICVFGTHTLYQFPREALLRLLKAMQTFSKQRPVYFLSMEGTADAHSKLTMTVYREGDRQSVDLANCHPHGYWLEWLYDASLTK